MVMCLKMEVQVSQDELVAEGFHATLFGEKMRWSYV
jgi:hypothetical protein